MRPGGNGNIKGRDEEIDYAEAHNVPLKISRETNYSKDKNLWHLSHEGLDLEDPANEPQYDKPGFLEMSVCPLPGARPGRLCDFGVLEKGWPVAIDGEKKKASDIIRKLNQLGGDNGIGLLDIKTIFGETSVRRKMRLNLVAELKQFDQGELMERLPETELFTEVLGQPIRKMIIPVGGGRNLAVLVEAAVRSAILQLRGINTIQEFFDRQRKLMEQEDGF